MAEVKIKMGEAEALLLLASIFAWQNKLYKDEDKFKQSVKELVDKMIEDGE